MCIFLKTRYVKNIYIFTVVGFQVATLAFYNIYSVKLHRPDISSRKTASSSCFDNKLASIKQVRKYKPKSHLQTGENMDDKLISIRRIEILIQVNLNHVRLFTA